jgi:regulator of sigma E protease
LISVAKAKAGTQVKIVYQRDSQELQAIVVPRKTPPKNQGALGAIISDLELKKYPFYQAPFVGLKESLRISVMFYKELGKIVGQLVTLQGPTVEVTGPIGIAKLTGQAVGYGFDAVIQLLGLLSLNLALINIIPFPALDGGQLSFVLFEAVSRRKISEDLKAKVNTIGFALLLGLLILITFKDIRGLF